MSFTKGVAGISQICEHLYVCGVHSLDIVKIRLAGISHVINLTVDIPETTADDVTCQKIAIHDSPHAKLSEHFDACADRIEQVHIDGGKTLVHCMAGASRSTTICIAYLMKHQKMNLKDAYKLVKLRRIMTRPNVGFFRQLIEYERTLFGETSVAIVTSPIGPIPDVYLHETKGMLCLDGASGQVVASDMDL